VLLFSQFAILRARGLLFLAGGYLFTAPVALIHALTFPGLFAPTGLLGAGTQTTAWLYMIWHAGLPLMVIVYGLSNIKAPVTATTWSVGRSLAAAVAAVLAALLASIWITVGWHDILPALVINGRETPIETVVTSSICCLTLAALLTLWRRRQRSVLDLWLMVALCAWLFEVSLSAILNAGRFDLGFYAGRVYGLCAASFVLAVLLVDNVALQAQMSRLVRAMRREAAFVRDQHKVRERLFSAVVESSNDAIITQTLAGVISGWNPAAERLFGYAEQEAVGQHISLIVPSHRRDEVDDILKGIGRGELIEQFETVRIHKDGSNVDVSLSMSPLRSAAGDIIGASKIARDVTESKQTQSALTRESEERQRIFETSQDLILVTDNAGNFIQVSPSVQKILGYDPSEMIGRTAVDFIHPDDLDSTRQEMRAARRGLQVRNFEARYPHKDGHIVMLNWLGSWSEPVQRHFFIGRDLTDKHAAEAQMRQAQKMDAIGQLTGGVAHDFNNILTVITGTIGILGEAVADRPELVSIAKLIDDAAERGAQLTKHLLAFARKQPLQPVEVDINSLVLEAAKLLHPTLGEQIEISPRLSHEAWPALVDPSQLTTAVLNLSLNARDAMPDGGKLVLETSNVHLDHDYANMNSDVAAGDYIMIAVSDTGTGIPAALLEKVFDPFFTTKEVGKGTGLGLSMVFGFVKQSGGHIKIYSEEGHGTTVKIYLPRSTGQGQSASDLMSSMEVTGGNETVLVVEDDALVRQYVTSQVASLGYTTLESANGAEALKIIDGGADVDLLFTDVIMPGTMNGRQLVDEALKRRPELKILFTSGYTENAILHHGRLDEGVLLLAKPYRKPELARMLRVALNS
jgi:PAS domain S-box-containing protein